MDIIPNELLLDIHRRAPFLATSCKSGRALWQARAVTRLTTEGAEEDPEHFVRFVGELAEAGACVRELVLCCPDSAVVLWSGGEDVVRRLMRDVRVLDIDARVLGACACAAVSGDFDELIIRIQHACREGEVIDLNGSGVRARTVRVINEDWMPSEDPSMNWGVYYETNWRKKNMPQLVGISPCTETLEVCGAVGCGGARMGGEGLRRLVCDGCVLAGPLPVGLEELELTSARTLRSPNTLVGGCRALRRLHLDNMYVFASRIAEEVGDAWGATMEYYADEGSTCYIVNGTRKLASAKEFYVSSSTMTLTYADYRVPNSSALQKIRAERILINPADMPFIEACPSAELLDCKHFT